MRIVTTMINNLDASIHLKNRMKDGLKQQTTLQIVKQTGSCGKAADEKMRWGNPPSNGQIRRSNSLWAIPNSEAHSEIIM